MNAKGLALWLFTTWKVGYLGIFEAALMSGPGGWQVFYDLIVACGIACVYVAHDARARGVAAWPWLVTVPLLGSIPLITWIVLRDWIAPLPQGGGAASGAAPSPRG